MLRTIRVLTAYEKGGLCTSAVRGRDSARRQERLCCSGGGKRATYVHTSSLSNSNL